MLKETKYHLLLTDKDGGYAYISDDLLREAFVETIQGGDYDCSPFHPLQVDKSYKDICNTCSTYFQQPALESQLM